MLILPAPSRALLERLARAARPLEACGALLGSREGDVARVVEVVPARNVAADPRREFELDALDFMRADDAARGRGLTVVGLWHSHPDSPARPSAADRASAWRDGWCVIVSGSRPELRAWRLDGASLVEDELALDEPQPFRNA